MSESPVFVFKRQNEVRVYSDQWAGMMLYRELLFGPEAFESFASNFDLIDYAETNDYDAVRGVVVDYDNQALLWSEDFPDVHPKTKKLYDRLLESAWPGFQIELAQAGIDLATLKPAEDDEADYFFEDRVVSVNEAGRNWDDVDEEDDCQVFDDDESRAWVVVIDQAGQQRHRNLEQIPQEILRPKKKFTKDLIVLDDATNVPQEALVEEGFVIDLSKRELSLWGPDDLKNELETIKNGWQDWTVQWLENGYEDQCRLLDHSPALMSEAESLALIMPQLLSNRRMDMQNILGMMGGGLKKTAVKAVGCFYLLICVPIVIWGLVSGNWTAALITMAATLVVFAIIFKVVEFRLKKKFNSIVPSKRESNESRDDVPQVAGPQELPEREKYMEKLLAAAGLPTLAQVKEHCSDADELGMLYDS